MDIVSKFEKALRRRHHLLLTELAKIEHLIGAFEKGVKGGAKRRGRNRISAAGRKRIGAEGSLGKDKEEVKSFLISADCV